MSFREQDGSKSRDSFITTEEDCDAMKIVILITVVESLAVMLAIVYFYYRRSESGECALVLRRAHVSITEQASLYYRLATTRNDRSLINRVTGITSNPKIKK